MSEASRAGTGRQRGNLGGVTPRPVFGGGGARSAGPGGHRPNAGQPGEHAEDFGRGAPERRASGGSGERAERGFAQYGLYHVAPARRVSEAKGTRDISTYCARPNGASEPRPPRSPAQRPPIRDRKHGSCSCWRKRLRSANRFKRASEAGAFVLQELPQL